MHLIVYNRCILTEITTRCQTSECCTFVTYYNFCFLKAKISILRNMLVFEVYLLCFSLWHKGWRTVEYSKCEVWRNLTVLRKAAKLLTRNGFLDCWRVDWFLNPLMNCCTMELTARWIFHISPSWRNQKVANSSFVRLISLVDFCLAIFWDLG